MNSIKLPSFILKTIHQSTMANPRLIPFTTLQLLSVMSKYPSSLVTSNTFDSITTSFGKPIFHSKPPVNSHHQTPSATIEHSVYQQKPLISLYLSINVIIVVVLIMLCHIFGWSTATQIMCIKSLKKLLSHNLLLLPIGIYLSILIPILHSPLNLMSLMSEHYISFLHYYIKWFSNVTCVANSSMSWIVYYGASIHTIGISFLLISFLLNTKLLWLMVILSLLVKKVSFILPIFYPYHLVFAFLMNKKLSSSLFVLDSPFNCFGSQLTTSLWNSFSSHFFQDLRTKKKIHLVNEDDLHYLDLDLDGSLSLIHWFWVLPYLPSSSTFIWATRPWPNSS